MLLGYTVPCKKTNFSEKSSFVKIKNHSFRLDLDNSRDLNKTSNTAEVILLKVSINL